MDLKNFITLIPDYPEQGVSFKDITPLFNNAKAFQYVIEAMTEFVKACEATVIVSPEARGFLFGPTVAYTCGLRFVPVRKPGKLPREVDAIEYSLEYGSNIQEIHKDALNPSDKVVIIDDILATGGTIKAIIKLIENQQAQVEGVSFLADLAYLHKSTLFSHYKRQTLVTYLE